MPDFGNTFRSPGRQPKCSSHSREESAGSKIVGELVSRLQRRRCGHCRNIIVFPAVRPVEQLRTVEVHCPIAARCTARAPTPKCAQSARTAWGLAPVDVEKLVLLWEKVDPNDRARHSAYHWRQSIFNPRRHRDFLHPLAQQLPPVLAKIATSARLLICRRYRAREPARVKSINWTAWR
jgi:hypothetical protein